MKTKKTSILISGSYGTGNLGDELILKVITDLLKDFDLTVLSQGPEYTRAHFRDVKCIEQTPSFKITRIVKDLLKLRFINFKKRALFLCHLLKTDIFWVGGGGLFSEFSKSVLPYYLFQIRLAKLFKKKVYIIGVGVGPLRTSKGKKLLANTLNHCADILIVRDQKSYDDLKAIGVTKEVTLAPDLAFYYTPPRREKRGPKRPTVILNVYALYEDSAIWPNQGHRARIHFDELNSLILKLLEQNYHIEILPLGTTNDLHFAKKLHQSVQNENCTVFVGRNYKDIIERYQHAHLVIAMRFHAGLIALLHQLPCLALDQQGKLERLYNDLGLKNGLYVLGDGINRPDKIDLDSELAFQKFSALEQNYSTLRVELEDVLTNQKSKLQSVLNQKLKVKP